MKPAFSVILFTVLSGFGCGLFVWTQVLWLFFSSPLSADFLLVSTLIGVFLLGVSGLCSVFHLGRPERAWRAFSQWRTSWLSREGIALLVTIFIATLFALLTFLGMEASGLLSFLGILLLLFSLVTTYTTAMIYASLKAIPAWSNGFVIAGYFIMALASGGISFLFLLAVMGEFIDVIVPLALCLFAALAVKASYWIYLGGRTPQANRASAIGAEPGSKVRALDPPHTGANFLTSEMAYKLNQKKSWLLRHVSTLMAFVLPALILLFQPTKQLSPDLLPLGFALGLLFCGLIIERWLFFADAQHAMRLYYDRHKI